MHAEIGDRIVLHGRQGTRIGVVVEGIEDGGSRVHWADGGESILSAGTEAPEDAGRATWNAAKSAPALTWRRGVIAGVGREASIAQDKLAAKVVNDVAEEQAEEPAATAHEEPAEEPTEHKPASGE